MMLMNHTAMLQYKDVGPPFGCMGWSAYSKSLFDIHAVISMLAAVVSLCASHSYDDLFSVIVL